MSRPAIARSSSTSLRIGVAAPEQTLYTAPASPRVAARRRARTASRTSTKSLLVFRSPVRNGGRAVPAWIAAIRPAIADATKEVGSPGPSTLKRRTA